MTKRNGHKLGPGITGYSGTLDAQEVAEIIAEQARQAGCTCPTLTVLVPDPLEAGALRRVQVEHDDDCPLVNP